MGLNETILILRLIGGSCRSDAFRAQLLCLRFLPFCIFARIKTELPLLGGVIPRPRSFVNPLRTINRTHIAIAQVGTIPVREAA